MFFFILLYGNKYLDSLESRVEVVVVVFFLSPFLLIQGNEIPLLQVQFFR